MRTKPREDAKHERRNGNQAGSFAIDAALRTVDFHRVWLPEPAAADRPREIHRVVAVSLSVDRRGNRMGDVSVLTLKELYFRVVPARSPQQRYANRILANHPNCWPQRVWCRLSTGVNHVQVQTSTVAAASSGVDFPSERAVRTHRPQTDCRCRWQTAPSSRNKSGQLAGAGRL